ncbi:conserved hypothetical protein [Pirellula staleyi DSM 6068]|uniref:Reverse transcriptase domain-containing protein n=1 Tax=Pirellula staleyi (strain ATCC 27377 / DSM 6068 / ICPB 4128) TaxID=530564 RepID=D2QY14_PIRSD|nr:RNA-directed DNA polymerase [Pirellula staleyi]ADB18091.1 conserved hypothetical protein [Pirellula staleyi DSM 6068]
MKKRKRKKEKSPKKPVAQQPSLSSDFVSMKAMYQAYQKAKVDVFYERSQPRSQEFCEYERNLHANLTALQKTLTRPRTNWFKSNDFIGSYGFIPKGLQIPEPDGDQDSAAHFSVSNPDDAWNVMMTSLGEKRPIAEFRPVALFTVNMYVVCALWVNLVGHMFDACLDSSARGTRLRRLRQTDEELPECGRYHLSAPGSFKPYFSCYKEWREKGLRAIRQELAKDRKVVAITMDLKAFYHNVDPKFILNEKFLDAIRFSNVNGSGLYAAEERIFTKQIVTAFLTWAKKLPHLKADTPPGLPVGVSAARIVANVLLAEFDRLAQQKLDPIYYSRYVDDIFLVLRDNGRMRTSRDVLKHLCRRIKPLNANDDLSVLTLAFPYSNGCKLLFQAKKQRVFLLSGEVGADLLDTIESQIDAVSSEWRLLPDLDALEKSPAAKILTATRRADENADTLRKADQLSLKRLSFSIMLRQYDTLAHDLPPNEWKRERKRFYRFAERHVLTPLRLLDLNDYLPRLLGLAVSCRDWTVAGGFLKRISDGIERLRNNVSVEPNAGADSQWEAYLRHLQTALREAVVRSYPLKQDNHAAENAAKSLLEVIDALNPLSLSNPQDISALSCELFWTDLGRIPFKNALLGYVSLPPCTLKPLKRKLPKSQMKRLGVIREFLRGADTADIKVQPLLFPTRPFSPREITEFDCRSAWELDRLRDYVVALRGTWVKPVAHTSRAAKTAPAPESGSPKTREVLVFGDGNRKHVPRIAITSFLTEESSWAKAAEGTPELSAERYKRLVRLANAVVTSPHRAEYVVFPELSIPRRWLPGLAGLFIKAGISLITGVEYRRVPPEPSSQVVNEAYLVLADDRLGYRSWCVVRQQKGVPAHHERDELRSKFGLTLAAPASKDDPKPIYRHFGHGFGVLICSELTDIRFRQEMRGDVDTLFVLSWNQDLESFGALVEAAVLDVHCYMVLVNNRKYGDSRVRTPSKKNWMRDLVRIKGGLDDYFVVTDLEIMSLRNFQSYHEPPLGDDALFKPTPEGFKIATRRKQTPRGNP